MQWKDCMEIRIDYQRCLCMMQEWFSLSAENSQ